MKKIILSAGLIAMAMFANAQGLEQILVEKYYVSNGADATASVGALPTGSVTWRIYADMAPGYKFKAAYGDPAHTLSFSTTTAFFNNEDRGATTPTYTKAQAAANTVMLDSWVTVGGACVGQLGITKAEDNGVATVAHTTALLNNDPSAGIPLTTQDGLIAGSPVAVTFVGTVDLTNFDATSNAGNSVTVTNGAWSSLTGSIGPVAGTNRVLIAQITTDGVLTYALNVQLQSPGGAAEKYVSSSPAVGEQTMPSLSGTLFPVNPAPIVNITSPANGAGIVTGDNVTINATATDNGSVSQVEFFVDGSSIFVDATAPYSANYTVTAGSHTVTAVATDNEAATASTSINISGVANPAPVAVITSPATTVIVGNAVTVTATATDNISVTQLEFFNGATSLGVFAGAGPYSVTYTTTALGANSITAVATDNLGATGTSAAVVVTVVADPAPTATITSPSTGTSVIGGDDVAITATATDNISVAQVEFFVGATSIGVDLTAPYTATYTTSPTASGVRNLTARATDNLGNIGISSVVVLNYTANQAPTVAVTSPAPATSTTASVVAVAATAADADGTVAQVEFLVDGIVFATDLTAPFTANYPTTVGVHNLTARATDNKGAQTTSAAVLITIIDANAAYQVVTSYSICNAPTFCLPVSAVVPAVNVNGYDVVLAYDPLEVTPTGNVTIYSDLGVVPAHVDNVNNAATANGTLELHVFFNSLAGATEAFNGTGKVFCVEFTRTAAFTSIDTASFDITSLQESYDFGGTAIKTVQSGTFRTFHDSTYTFGTLNFWLDNAPLGYTAGTNLITKIYGNNAANNNQSLAFVTPNSIGTFTYNVSNGLYLNIERDIPNATLLIQNVVNSGDAILARRILTKDITLVPSVFQMVASDVSLDGKISAGDITQINKRSVNTLAEYGQVWNAPSTAFAGQPSKDWLFLNNSLLALPAYTISATYPNNDGSGYSLNFVPQVPFNLALAVVNYTLCPDYFADSFRGVLLGDVNGNFSPANSGTQFLKKEAANKVVFDFEKAEIKGNTIELPVSFVSKEVVNALDFAFQFNENKLKFESVVSNLNDASQQVTYNYSAEHKMVLAGTNSLNNFDAKAPVLTARFTILAVTVSQADFKSFAGYVNGYDAGVAFSSNVAVASNEPVISVYPNPASSVLNVMVSENATVQLVDVTGKQVIAQTTVNANQAQSFNTLNIANGVYTMKVTSNESVTVVKVVINN